MPEGNWRWFMMYQADGIHWSVAGETDNRDDAVLWFRNCVADHMHASFAVVDVNTNGLMSIDMIFGVVGELLRFPGENTFQGGGVIAGLIRERVKCL